MKTQSIKREHLKEIYDVACTEWKTKLANKAKEEPFNDLIFSEEEIKEMFKAATTDQKPVLEKYFTLEEYKNAFVKKFGVYDIEEMSRKLFDDKLAFQILGACTPKSRMDLEGRAFFVPRIYSVEIGEAQNDGTWISIHKK